MCLLLETECLSCALFTLVFSNFDIVANLKDQNPAGMTSHIHKALVLRPACVPERVDVNKKGVNQKHSRREYWNRYGLGAHRTKGL